MKNLIVYYSYGGNTKQIAEYINSKIQSDIVELVPKTAYSNDYELVVENTKSEIKDKTTPEILPLNINIDSYDNIILGTPVWWYTFAPVVRTFLNSYNLEGKNIYVFATNGGWVGHTFADIRNLLNRSNISNEIDIYFSTTTLKTSKNDIDKFINSIK